MSFTLDDDEDGMDAIVNAAPPAANVSVPPAAAEDIGAANSSPNPPVALADTSGSFNIDDFLDSSSAKTTSAAPPGPPAATESFSIDDFLGDSTPSPVAAAAPLPGETAVEPAIVAETTTSAAEGLEADNPAKAPAAAGDDDFLTWLDNDPPQAATRPPLTTGVATVAAAPTASPRGPDTAATLSSSTAKSAKKLKYESELLRIITSGFPDVMKLQSLIAANGYIPRDLRGQVWCLLVSGTCSEDQEADFWQSTGMELPNHAEVVSDCEAAIEKCRRRGTTVPAAVLKQAKSDLVDILVLYCVRRTIPYKPLYCDLLAPMVVGIKPLSRTVASSCFYSLCSEFIPIINLPVAEQDHASDKLHQLLRLLLLYHYPKLSSHLDRVLKGWEKRTKSISAATALKFDAAARDRAELDMLERDFGLSPPVDEGEDGAAAATGPVDVTSAEGRIPENWLYCVFGASLPLEQSCWLWDWVLSTGDKFSGLYIVVALFGLYSEALSTMSGPQISEWISSISTGASDDWFLKLPVSFPGDAGKVVVGGLTWERFTRGWIHAAEAVRHVTPTSFQASLNSLEQWASPAASLDSNQVGDSEGGLDGSANSESRNALDRSGGRGDEPPAGSSSLIIERLRRISVQMQKPPDGGAASEGLRSRFSRVLGGNSAANDISAGLKASGSGEVPGHVTPLLASRCIWANVAEVVPCLCSSSKQRQAIPAQQKVVLAFKAGAAWGGGEDATTETAPQQPGAEESVVPQKVPSRSNSVSSQDSTDGVVSADRGGEGFVIPLMAREKDQPFFFAIDCRGAANEISLGKFPKAYSLDPEDLKDSYMTSTILRTLEPMANQFHFCIMGVGEEFFVHRAAALASKAGKGRALAEAPTVDTLRKEYHQNVASVLDFFQKRDFKHVSFLEGGFTAAVRFLMKDDCPYSVDSCLVDVEGDTLDTVFGPGTASTQLHSRRAGGGSDAASGQGGPAGGSSFLSTLSKADIFAGSNTAGGDVVEVSPPQNSKPGAVGPSGLLSFMSSIKSNQPTPAGDTNPGNSDSSATSDSVASVSTGGSGAPPSGERLGELKSKMSLFGSSTLASLRRVSQSVGSGANGGGNVGTSSGVSVDDKSKDSRGGASGFRPTSKPERESSAFVIDDDEEDEEGGAEADTSPAAPAADANKGTFITRVGGVLRSATIQGTDKEAGNGSSSAAAGSIARLQGGGLIDVDPDKIGVSKTEAEKAQALAMHKLSGVVKGDQITINRESLPGALLFPARKIKLVPVPGSPSSPKRDDSTTGNDEEAEVEMQEQLLHRYIVVTKERIIVLDSGGGGVGSVSHVKSNHHLTELVKLTFKKRDPELLTLFVAQSLPGMPEDDDDDGALDEKQRGGAKPVVPPKQKQYRVTKRDELVEVLQKYMRRFR